MTPGAQTMSNCAIYGSAKPLVIKFMVWMANPAQFWSFAMACAFFESNCLNCGVYACLSTVIIIFTCNNIKNNYYFVFFLGKLAQIIFSALGAFDALIHRTDSCPDKLWLLVQPHHSIHSSYKRYTNRHLSQHMLFRYCDKDSGEPVQMYRLASAFSACIGKNREYK